jgi:hypothetical protein
MARERVKKSVGGIALTKREQMIYDAMREERRTYTAEDIARIYYDGRQALPDSWRTVVLRVMRSLCVKSRLVCDRAVVRVSRLGVSAPATYRILTEKERVKIEGA